MTWYASEAAALLLVFQLPAGHMALSDFDCGFSAEAGSRLSGGVHAGTWLLETDGREGRRRTIGGDNGEKVQSSIPPLNTLTLSPPDTCERNRQIWPSHQSSDCLSPVPISVCNTQALFWFPFSYSS